MKSPVFVDSPILVAARNGSEPERQAAAQRWVTQLWQSHSGRLSQTELDEFYVRVTEELSPGLPAAVARAEVRDLSAWEPLEVDGDLREAAWNLADVHELSYRQALLVAAAEAALCSEVLTDRFDHDLLLGSVRVVNPFHADHRTTYLNEPGGESEGFVGLTS